MGDIPKQGIVCVLYSTNTEIEIRKMIRASAAASAVTKKRRALSALEKEQICKKRKRPECVNESLEVSGLHWPRPEG